jgi:CubicO group peptidase (beta-lactamase class C family)
MARSVNRQGPPGQCRRGRLRVRQGTARHPEITSAMAPTRFETDYGFRRDSVHLGNWRSAPWNVWAFRNIPELIPTARIEAEPDSSDEEPATDAGWLGQEVEIAGRRCSVAGILQATHTDALVVMTAGRVAAEFHAPHFTGRSRHILFSASKSVTGILAGILVGDGVLDPDERVGHYVPELARSAFGDAAVRHVLDMRTSLAFTEDYGDPRGDFARYRRAGLLDPQLDGEPRETVIGFLASLQKGPGDHGGPFTYGSPNSDVLGLVVERASGLRFADLASSRLWRPLGARHDAAVTVDIEGTARSGGGLFVAARDFARIGELMRCGGTVGDRRIVPEAWVRDTVTGGDAAAWRGGNFADWLPQGRYRNKWYQAGTADGAFFALGIHGQWLYVNPAAEMVIAKFSSQPVPVDDAFKHLNLGLFAALPALL